MKLEERFLTMIYYLKKFLNEFYSLKNFYLTVKPDNYLYYKSQACFQVHAKFHTKFKTFFEKKT